MKAAQDPLKSIHFAAKDPLKSKYEVGAKIGSGTFGVVHRGYERTTSVPVALKFVDELDDNREMQLLSRLQHESITPLLEYIEPMPSAGRTRGVLVFRERESDLRRFIERRRADSVFRARAPSRGAGTLSRSSGSESRAPAQSRGAGTLPRSLVATWARQLLGGISYLHAEGVVHRDLKPANVLLYWNNDSSTMAVEIADFGAARDLPQPQQKRRKKALKTAVDRHGNELTVQMQGLTPHVCTYEYAAPEMWFGGTNGDDDNRYGCAADVWSYGTVLFELLTFERFVVGTRSADRVACAIHRIGDFPEETGRNLGLCQGPLLSKARLLLSASAPPRRACDALDSFAASASPRCAWDHVACALRWLPEMRLTAKELLKSACFVDANALAQEPPGASAGGSGVSAQVAEIRLSRDVSDLSPSITQSDSRCSCSGHCNVKGHRHRSSKPGRHVCTSTELVVGCTLCVHCQCSIIGCKSPKNKGDYCFGHKRVVAKLPWNLQAARAARHILPIMVPCDVVAMVAAFPSLRSSLAMTVLAAWLKEPTAVKSLGASAPLRGAEAQRGPDIVFEKLMIALRCVSEEADRTAQRQINKQGVARWMGALSAARVLGIVGDAPEDVGLCGTAGSSQHQLKLSCQAKEKPLYAANACTSRLREFVEACHSQEQIFCDLLRKAKPDTEGALQFPSQMSAILHTLNGKAGMKWKAYAVQNMTRRLLIAWLSDGIQNLCDSAGFSAKTSTLDWSSIQYSELEFAGTIADVHQVVNHIVSGDPNATCADVSELILGRRDHALYVSMWACSFNDVTNMEQARSPKQRERIIDFLESAESRQLVEAFRGKHGVAPCVQVLVQMWCHSRRTSSGKS